MGTPEPRDGDVVLIVDDVPDNLAVLSDLLGEAGMWCSWPPTASALSKPPVASCPT